MFLPLSESIRHQPLLDDLRICCRMLLHVVALLNLSPQKLGGSAIVHLAMLPTMHSPFNPGCDGLFRCLAGNAYISV
jgi:hypothetical protein